MGNKLTNDDFKLALNEIGERAVIASRKLAIMSSQEKDDCLEAMAEAILREKDYILRENQRDLENGVANGMSQAMLDRLRLNEARVAAMAEGLRQVARLEDPVGITLSNTVRPNGLEIKKVSVPIGVIAIIYEARPNVTVDAAALCLKSGNAVILRGGSESIHSNLALAHCLTRACIDAGIEEAVVQVLPWTDRRAVQVMLKMDAYIDLVIPRGGESLIRAVMEESTIPVIKHYKGVCNIFVDKSCDQEMAVKLIENAKCQRPGVCNAAETLLIHKDIAAVFAPKIAAALLARQVELRGDDAFRSFAPQAIPATEDDWGEEYLALVLAVRVVDDLDAAIAHINRYGSKHSDLIISDLPESVAKFMAQVDSSTVYVNASTRFTDGYEFGMGAEIGISTDKLHARGPMGPKELTIYKYQVYGNGQIRT